jgi:AcrR family transcriptional regulator
MSPTVPKNKNKHQIRTEETQAKILDAAEAAFSERGFENTQLEDIATRAGYTRGAIYAHYVSKEDLFLALMDQRVLAKLGAMRAALEAESDISKRPRIFHRWLTTQAGDQAWGTLMLEFKLYAMRRPESRDRLMRTYDQMTESFGSDFIDLLFGPDLDKAARAAAERRLAILGAIISAVNLESHFRPKLLRKQQLQIVLDELFVALISSVV